MPRPVLAWHFLPENGRTRYNDLAVVVGETMKHDGPVELCESGLHASVKLYDALYYAPGPILCRVRLSGNIKRGDDKLVASERTVLWMFDASKVLRLWGCWCIRNTPISGGRTTWGLLTDLRSRKAVEVAERFAVGGATKEELADARAAARDAAWAAARDVAWAVARDAAWDAARDAARDAAWDAHSKKLVEMVRDEAASLGFDTKGVTR